MKFNSPIRFAFAALLLCGIITQPAQAAEKISIAAAADLKFALDEIINVFSKTHSEAQIEVTYGSSGKFHTQIQQGAPYDLYFSADIAYPRQLKEQGFSASDVQPYALGRIVLWSASRDARKLSLSDLADPSIQKIAIANPQHAPYGQRAAEALKATGIWDKVETKLVYGENVAQTAQFVASGNAQIGIIALSLALSPELAKQGGYALIPENLHQPLSQGFILTQHAANNKLAQEFARFMASSEARALMSRYGFSLPNESK